MRQKVQEEIYRKQFPEFYQVNFSDLPKDMLKGDIIDIIREEAFYTENNSCDGSTELVIIRVRDESDEEIQKRKDFYENLREMGRQKRYEDYLQLKAEFEK